MPSELRENALIPIYKTKGEIRRCRNYGRIKLMSHTTKI